MVFYKMGGAEQEEQKLSSIGLVWLKLTFKNHTCFVQKKIFQRFVIRSICPLHLIPSGLNPQKQLR